MGCSSYASLFLLSLDDTIIDLDGMLTLLRESRTNGFDVLYPGSNWANAPDFTPRGPLDQAGILRLLL
jgi:hypothetical protein